MLPFAPSPWITSGLYDDYPLQQGVIMMNYCNECNKCVTIVVDNYDCCNKLVVCQSKPNMNPDKVKDHLMAPDFLIGISSTVIMEIMITVQCYWLSTYGWVSPSKHQSCPHIDQNVSMSDVILRKYLTWIVKYFVIFTLHTNKHQ